MTIDCVSHGLTVSYWSGIQIQSRTLGSFEQKKKIIFKLHNFIIFLNCVSVSKSVSCLAENQRTILCPTSNYFQMILRLKIELHYRDFLPGCWFSPTGNTLPFEDREVCYTKKWSRCNRFIFSLIYTVIQHILPNI